MQAAGPWPGGLGTSSRGGMTAGDGRGQRVMAGVRAEAGGPGPGVSAGHRAARIWRTARGSSTVAITRSRPPQWGHANTSIANARRMRACRALARRDHALRMALRGSRPSFHVLGAMRIFIVRASRKRSNARGASSMPTISVVRSATRSAESASRRIT
jgi:hypothetical protein